MNEDHKDLLNSIGQAIRINKRPDGAYSATAADNQDSLFLWGARLGQKTYDFPFNSKEEIQRIATEAVQMGLLAETAVVISNLDAR